MNYEWYDDMISLRFRLRITFAAPAHAPQTQQPWSWSLMDPAHVPIDTASTENNGGFVLNSEHGPLDSACDDIVDLDMVNMVQIIDEHSGSDNHEDPLPLQICVRDGDRQSPRHRHGHSPSPCLSLSPSGSQGHGHSPDADADSHPLSRSVGLGSLSSHSPVSVASGVASGSPSSSSDCSSCLIESDPDPWSSPPPVPTDESMDSLFEEDAPSPIDSFSGPGQPRLALRFNVLLWFASPSSPMSNVQKVKTSQDQEIIALLIWSDRKSGNLMYGVSWKNDSPTQTAAAVYITVNQNNLLHLEIYHLSV